MAGKLLKFLLLNGEGGGHNEDGGAVVGAWVGVKVVVDSVVRVMGGVKGRLDCRLQGRFHANNGDFGIFLTKGLGGNASGGVAGDDDSFGATSDETIDVFRGELANLGSGFFAIGSVNRIAEIEKIFVRKLLDEAF